MAKNIKHRDPIAFDLFTNGLYRQKVVPNKKKILKKFDVRKENW